MPPNIQWIEKRSGRNREKDRQPDALKDVLLPHRPDWFRERC
jgi:hypothetical protein